MSNLTIKDVPKLKISKEVRPVQNFNSSIEHEFHYEVHGHDKLPHIVKFSGGRSSGMMLFVLLEAGFLNAERGDVVLFNNTSAEHPLTYDFTHRCKELVETRYNIPFFCIEFQTYEDARNGEWTRIPSYRLVQPKSRSESFPDGYQWRGEAYEELLSLTGFVPNQFQRICTSELKIETSRAFLKDWFSRKPGIERLGHYGNSSRIDDDELYDRHLRNNGAVPKDIFLKKKAYVRSRPVSRSAQRFADFSSAYRPFFNQHFDGKRLGEDIEYLAFVGLRFDEMRRVVKVRRRNAGGPEAISYKGEHVYMPLSDMGVTLDDVEGFWEKQDWNLELSAKDGLSNCTYCFLKGMRGLQKVHTALGSNVNQDLKGTPCDIGWWIDIEQRYGRDLEAEDRKIRGEVANNFIGFFGTKSGFAYEKLANIQANSNLLGRYEDSILPCDCTD